MGKNKQSYRSFHLHLSNQLRHLPRKLVRLRSDPPAAHVTGTEIEAAIFDSFRSLGLSDCNLNSDQMLEPVQYNRTAVMVPPSDRFFVSPSTSGSLAWDCNCNVSLQEEEEDLTVTVPPPSYLRFFVCPSTSGLITDLDQRVVKSSEAVQSPSSFASNSTISSDQSVLLLASSSASNSAESDDNMMAPEDATSSSSSDHALLIPGDGIAVSTDSVDPYQDFKRSMQEMLLHYYAEDARRSGHQLALENWDLLEELLFCYLELNDRSMHRYIIRAFADVVRGSCMLSSTRFVEEDQIN